MAENRSLEGKVAIISGGARGIGAAHVRLFVARGARVVFGDVLDAEATALAAEIGSRVCYQRLDVRLPEDWAAIVDRATAEFGPVDILVNNAAIHRLGAVDECSLETFREVLDINLCGVLLGIQAVTPGMKALGRGSIVNIASTAGLMGYAGLAAYVSAKFGVQGLTKAAALDLADFGIRVNSVHPGAVRSAMTEGYPEEPRLMAMHRLGDPLEIARMSAFVASDDASFSTGGAFVVDGGTVAGIAGIRRMEERG